MAKRDARGRWLPGNTGNKNGRKPGTLLTKRTELGHLFVDETREQWPEIVGKIFHMAKEGNMKAIYLIFEYAIAKPASTHIVEEKQEGETVDIGLIITQTRNQLLTQLRDIVKS